MYRKILSLLCAAVAGGGAVGGQVSLTDKGGFPLVAAGNRAAVCYDPADARVVKTAVELFAADVERVTGQAIAVSAGTEPPRAIRYAVIAGTVGHSRWIDELTASGKLDPGPIVGGWERYIVRLVERPGHGLARALVIAGSDRRGTAYGLLSVSRAIGVSPWYWWADAPVVRRKELMLDVRGFTSKEPSVRYRGIFINDEDWGILRWAKRNFEKERGNIGPKTYEKVCELLLRLNANYLAPAMHEASTAFHKIPENREVADRYAIVMGSSHCEPLLLNTASEWDGKSMGEWNYVDNRAGVDGVLKNRVVEAAPFENVYTLALRGLHDRAMAGSQDLDERRNTMQEALLSQRQILVDVLGKPAEEIPQAFTPYKEVLDVYDRGLQLPDDVTIVWPDDNYGYMKRLSSPAEQKRTGRSGIYYHASYLGRPHDYLWMNTTSPTLMYEELGKAYGSTADRIWLLNAGDIKGCEFAVDLFLAMAFDMEAFDFQRTARYRAEWTGGMLGQELRGELEEIVGSFYHLSFVRKPEFMGWGYQWATDKHGNERNTDTDFSFANYREADRRLAEYERIAAMAANIMARLPESHRACCYQTLYYPVKACQLLNRMILSGQKNRLYAMQQRAATEQLAETGRVCYDSLRVITKGYNSLLDGKWDQMMTMEQGFAASYFKLPELRRAELSEQAEMGIMAEGEGTSGVRSFHALPAFDRYLPVPHFVDVYNKGSSPLGWSATASDRWIVLSKHDGQTATEERIEVTVDWTLAPTGERVSGTVEIEGSDGSRERVFVSAFNPPSPTVEELRGLYVQHNGYISIDAAGFHRKSENDAIKVRIIPNLGVENIAVQLGDPVAPRQNTRRADVPRVEYDFFTFEQGSVDVYTYVLPTFVISADRGYAGHEATNLEAQYGVCIDEGPVMNPSTSSIEYAQIWYESALRNCRTNKTTLHIGKPGKHTLKIMCGDAGTVLQKVVLDFGGMARSYQGPPPTRCM
ncbi:MAG: glycosyl hydrolase 115 family protein [Rikenellaceae bacterium]|jgi:hypothetical protein|nr:glycosyl hydrolase 115 family protein [Rikenellaceae bacterium]